VKVVGKGSFKVNKLCERFGLEQYRTSIEAIFENIHGHGILTDIQDRKDSRKGDPFRREIIIIGVKDRSDPLHIIWSILHEFGHYLDTSEVGDNFAEKQLYREKLAWDIGFEELKKYPDLYKHKQSYLERADYCIELYKAKYK
jgi:hypothetical protein